MTAVQLPLPDNAYLAAYLRPFQRFLCQEDVSEILVNKPGQLWIERAGATTMECHDFPELDDLLVQRLASQVARLSHQGVNRERPLLSAMLPGGDRIQIVAPPATRAHWVMAIRRHRSAKLSLDAFSVAIPARSPPDPARISDDRFEFLKQAVAARQTILVSGGTSSGKTSFLTALMDHIPQHERIILVEDTPEIRLDRPNAIGLVAVKGEMGEARVTTDDLLQASLRLRPDRIILGELRGHESVSFLRAINTGHPGSISTIHANTPRGALEQLALMVMQTGIGLSRQDVMVYACSVVDIVVQLERANGLRGISAIQTTQDIMPL